MFVAAAALLSLLVSPSSTGCVGLVPPIAAPISASFAPTGPYSGHFGIDYGADPAMLVRAAAPGWVSFSGIVAGNQTVTVDHGGGLKTSYSYLDSIWIGRGAWVTAGRVVGTSGILHDGELPGLHFSTRIGGVYVDPGPLLGCPAFDITDGLHLAPVP